MLVGAAIGAGVFAVGAAVTRGESDSFYVWAYGFAIGPGVGALAGWLVDRSIGGQMVYVEPGRAPRSSVKIAPFVGRERTGVVASLRF